MIELSAFWDFLIQFGLAGLAVTSLILAIISARDSKKAKKYIETYEQQYVDLRYSSNTFAAESSFNTQFTFFNKGTMPASDVKISLLFPRGTDIIRISPPLKYEESEDADTKIVEVYITRLKPNIPIGFNILSEFEPISLPTIDFHEEKAVQRVSRAQQNN